jgi:hypothetical protein
MTKLNVSYNFNNIDDLNKDAILKSIVEPFKGSLVECARGLGRRDLVFNFEDFNLAESCYNILVERSDIKDLRLIDDH